MKRKDTTGNITLLPINRDTYIDRIMVDTPPEEEPPHGMFHLSFNNERKQLRGLMRYEAYGTLFPETGHVHIDTQYLKVRDFRSLQQMKDFLAEFGNYHINWLRGE
jgi:hypothetical protein